MAEIPLSPDGSHLARPSGVQASLRSTATHWKPTRSAIVLAWLAPLATFAFWTLFVADTVQRRPWVSLSVDAAIWVGLALLAATTLSYCSAMYLLGRAGALVRMRGHRRTSRTALNRAFRDDQSSLTVLVPSYAEEPRVVAATLWSAALQEFPDLRVVLLIDDNPDPRDPDNRAQLEKTRTLPQRMAETLVAPRANCAQALAEFQAGSAREVATVDVSRLVETLEGAARWLDDLAERYPSANHGDEFLIEHVFRALAEDLRTEARTLLHGLGSGHLPSRERILDGHRRLVRIFTAELGLFERKRYVSLSHEANKAMNLNSYLSLMGGAWTRERTADGDVLRPPAPGEESDLLIPDADFVLTLDADSIVLPDYCTRLVRELSRPGNEKVAVIQTPYCAVPGAHTMVERIAGATTDLQHLHHLGKTHFSATFWVGANAIIRREALDDIVQVGTERGFEIRTYIQDRTVIEDTESSMDLAVRGWRLVNYPERLSYSATPPDFGSLVVQRRRWANGGLIILPKTRGIFTGQWARDERIRIMEIALRTDYLTSIALTALAVPVLMLLPTMRLLGPTLFLTAIPFLVAQASDLRRLGHRAIDVVWVQALNLVLLPVNVAGVLKSLHQAATGRKIPFARTPKIADRVAAPLTFVLMPYAGALLFAVLAWAALGQNHWIGAAFATVAGTLLLVGSVTFVGVRAAAQDVASAFGWRPEDGVIRGACEGRPRITAFFDTRLTAVPVLVGSSDRDISRLRPEEGTS